MLAVIGIMEQNKFKISIYHQAMIRLGRETFVIIIYKSKYSNCQARKSVGNIHKGLASLIEIISHVVLFSPNCNMRVYKSK